MLYYKRLLCSYLPPYFYSHSRLFRDWDKIFIFQLFYLPFKIFLLSSNKRENSFLNSWIVWFPRIISHIFCKHGQFGSFK